MVNVKSHIYTFRLLAAKLFLYHKDLLWTYTSCAILQRAGWLGLDKHVLMILEDMDLSGNTNLYHKMIQVWRNVLREDRDRSSFIHWAPEEPFLIL